MSSNKPEPGRETPNKQEEGKFGQKPDQREQHEGDQGSKDKQKQGDQQYRPNK